MGWLETERLDVRVEKPRIPVLAGEGQESEPP